MNKKQLGVTAIILAGFLMAIGKTAPAYAAVENVGRRIETQTEGEPGIKTDEKIENKTDDKIEVTGERALGGVSYYLNLYYDTVENTELEAVNLLSEPVKIPDNVAIANVNERLNVRGGPGTDQEIVGYLIKDAYCCILEEAKEGWVKILSGDVTGYVKEEYLYKDQEAKEKAGKVGKIKATVEVNSMNLRSEPSTDKKDNIIAELTQGEKYEVLEELVVNKQDENAVLWVKLSYDGKEAYASKELVDLAYEWTPAEKVYAPAETPADQEQQKEMDKSLEEPSNPEQEERKEPIKSNASIAETRKNIIAIAESALGVKYVWAGNSLTTGADCSGYCLAVYQGAGVNTAGYTRSSYTIAVSPKGRSISRSELQPGDMVFYGKNGKINHVALYYGNGKIIHESAYDGKAVISSMDYAVPMKYRNFLD